MKEETITSRSNPLMTHLHKLQTSRGYRYATGEFCADGTKLLQEAITWYPGLHTVIACEGLPLPPLPEGVRLVRVPQQLMERISTMQTPQGVIFLCHMPKPKPLALSPGCLILDGVQDPGNLGTILRTADAFGVPVALCDGCADPYSEKTVRASMGAVLRTQPQQATAKEIVSYCKAHTIPLAATALSEASQDLRQAAVGNWAVLIGSEGQGVRQSLLEQADALFKIPMLPRCESLNAAVAASVVLWEMARNTLR